MKEYSGYIFDLDGTIYLGNQIIEGAAETIHYLKRQGKKLLFLTNKTIDSRDNYVKKLRGFGIQVEREHILNPATVTIRYLQDKYPGAKVYVIGEPILKEEFVEYGIRLSSSPEDTDVVVISWDREFHYSHLDFAYQAIRRGAVFLATHPDRTCPTDEGEVPDCGGMIGAIEGTTGQKVEVIMGKPSQYTISAALDILQVDVKNCLMVGDRLETDILMGWTAGMDTALVLTGVTTLRDIERAEKKPSYVLDSVHDILKLAKSH